MKCQEFDLNHALGVKIFEEIRLDGMVLEKGHTLNEEDIIRLKISGVPSVYGALMDENDLTLEAALGIVAAKLCGKNTAYAVGHDGICKITASVDGVFLCADDRVAKFNRQSHNLILNTVPPYVYVAAGEVIALLELTTPLAEQAAVDNILFSLSGNVDLLQVSEQKLRKTALIYTNFYNDAAETAHFTGVVRKLVEKFPDLQIDYHAEYYAPHTVEAVADAVEKAVADKNDVIFILPGLKSNYKDDVIPSAVRSFADEIVNLTIPQVGASDLIIAHKRGQKIISLPFRFDVTESPLAVHYIKLAVVNDKINEYDFARPQNVLLPSGGTLTPAERENLVAAGQNQSKGKAGIAAVILAAGVGSRAGRNKLMAETKEGKPLFLKAVEAAIKSKANPVFVVTGNQAAAMEEFLEDIDVNVIYNPAYRAGVKTSLNLGLKSVPAFCDGALLLPADMPNVDAGFIDKMIASYNKGQEKQLCIASWKGVKHNPVIWSKALYGVADLVPENADLRPVFMEHEDYTTLVEAPSAETLWDVTYVSDIEKLVGD